MNSPCKNCNDRFIRKEDGKTITCHMVCEKYGLFRADKKSEYQAKQQKNDYQSAMYDSATRMKKDAPKRRTK